MNQRQAAAKVQVERLQRRNEIINRIENLRIQIPFAKYIAVRRDTRNLKEQRAEAKKRHDELREQSLPLKYRVESYESRTKGFKQLEEKAQKEQRNLIVKVKACEEKNPEFESNASKLRNEASQVRKRVNERKRRILQMRDEVQKLEHTAAKKQEILDTVDPTEEEHLSVCIPSIVLMRSTKLQDSIVRKEMQLKRSKVSRTNVTRSSNNSAESKSRVPGSRKSTSLDNTAELG